MTNNHKATRPSLLVSGVLSLSFWSSGVFLVRALAAYDLWSSPLYVGIIFVTSLPLAYITIPGTKQLLQATHRTMLSILAAVMALHSLALTLSPQIYALHESAQLPATAWLLWFSGAALLSILYSDRQNHIT